MNSQLRLTLAVDQVLKIKCKTMHYVYIDIFLKPAFKISFAPKCKIDILSNAYLSRISYPCMHGLLLKRIL